MNFWGDGSREKATIEMVGLADIFYVSKINAT